MRNTSSRFGLGSLIGVSRWAKELRRTAASYALKVRDALVKGLSLKIAPPDAATVGGEPNYDAREVAEWGFVLALKDLCRCDNIDEPTRWQKVLELESRRSEMGGAPALDMPIPLAYLLGKHVLLPKITPDVQRQGANVALLPTNDFMPSAVLPDCVQFIALDSNCEDEENLLPGEVERRKKLLEPLFLRKFLDNLAHTHGITQQEADMLFDSWGKVDAETIKWFLDKGLLTEEDQSNVTDMDDWNRGTCTFSRVNQYYRVYVDSMLLDCIKINKRKFWSNDLLVKSVEIPVSLCDGARRQQVAQQLALEGVVRHITCASDKGLGRLKNKIWGAVINQHTPVNTEASWAKGGDEPLRSTGLYYRIGKDIFAPSFRGVYHYVAECFKFGYSCKKGTIAVVLPAPSGEEDADFSDMIPEGHDFFYWLSYNFKARLIRALIPDASGSWKAFRLVLVSRQKSLGEFDEQDVIHSETIVRSWEELRDTLANPTATATSQKQDKATPAQKFFDQCVDNLKKGKREVFPPKYSLLSGKVRLPLWQLLKPTTDYEWGLTNTVYSARRSYMLYFNYNMNDVVLALVRLVQLIGNAYRNKTTGELSVDKRRTDEDIASISLSEEEIESCGRTLREVMDYLRRRPERFLDAKLDFNEGELEACASEFVGRDGRIIKPENERVFLIADILPETPHPWDILAISQICADNALAALREASGDSNEAGHKEAGSEKDAEGGASEDDDDFQFLYS